VTAALLSDEWLAECNAALARAGLTRPSDAAGGPLVVTEHVSGAPQGLHDALTQVADETGVRLLAGADPSARAWVSVGFEDAEALHAGRLDPASALTEGRIRVRGDLQALVDAVGLLGSAHEALRER